MIISISGTHCTGKSTLVGLLKKAPELKDAVFYKSSGRALAESNPYIKINEDGDFFTQLYILSRDVHNILENARQNLVICDRSFLDTYVYSLYLHQIEHKLSYQEMAVLQGLFDAVNSLVQFDKVFLLKPSFDLQQEKNRSMNSDFQTKIYQMFDRMRLPNWEYLPDDDKGRVERFLEFVSTGK